MSPADARPGSELVPRRARCVLVVKHGPLAGRRFEVDSTLEIGRHGTPCTLTDPQVSRRHAIVRVHAEEVVIEDLGSANGTWVNDLRIEGPTVLHDDDVLRIGTTVLAVEIPAPETMTAPEQAGCDRDQGLPGQLCALLVRDGPLAGRRFEVESTLEIGRQGTACTLTDPQVSRRHAVVRVDANEVVIEDLDSANGTWVNDVRVEGPIGLRDGDVLRIGTTTLAVEIQMAGTVTPAPKSVDAPTDPQRIPARARRSMITVAALVVVIAVAVTVLLLLAGGK